MQKEAELFRALQTRWNVSARNRSSVQHCKHRNAYFGVGEADYHLWLWRRSVKLSFECIMSALKHHRGGDKGELLLFGDAMLMWVMWTTWMLETWEDNHWDVTGIWLQRRVGRWREEKCENDTMECLVFGDLKKPNGSQRIWWGDGSNRVILGEFKGLI